MSFKEVADLDCSVTTAIGGKDKKSGKTNPKSIEGYFIGTRQVKSAKSKNGVASLHILQTEKGNVGVWGKTNLDQKMISVTPGCMIRISFTGMVETKNNPMYKYKVEIDADNSIDVSSISTGQEPEGEEYSAAAEETNDTEAYEAEEETAVDEDEPQADEVAAARAAPPKRPLTTPDAERRQRVQNLLNGKSKAAS